MYKQWKELLFLMMLLVGCCPSPTPGPTPAATAPPAGNRPAGGGMAVSGEVVPIRQVMLSFTLAGKVQSVAVAAGEEVGVEQVLVVLQTDALEAGVAQAALDQGTLRAPFTSTVASVDVSAGETAVLGQVVLELADLSHLQVATTDLSEQDVARLTVGRQATVYVEPLGLEVGGRVVRVASRAEVLGGDVVYRVVVELDEQPAGLRWGMSADVEITTD